MISTRVSFRWVPDPPSERTSTIVLTSPRGHFVDVRLLVASDTTSGSQPQHNTFELDWAFAGTAKHEIVDGTKSETGVLEDLPDGNTLEKGWMEDPERGGELREHEEVWSDEVCSEQSCWVLSSGAEGGKRPNGMIVRIGNVVQGVSKTAGGQIIVLRSRYGKSADRSDDEMRWEVEYEKGPAIISFVRPDAIEEAQEGDKLISQGGTAWVVQEIYKPDL